MPKSEEPSYWYVTYSYMKGYVPGTGAMACTCPGDWFMIAKTTESIRKNNDMHGVSIIAWTQITQAQFDEYTSVIQ